MIPDVAVFPMHMGMVPLNGTSLGRNGSIPHAHGDGSGVPQPMVFIYEYSPCTWGWFRRVLVSASGYIVFPMHMGMVPTLEEMDRKAQRIPHACGDDSSLASIKRYPIEYSPRMWGVFLTLCHYPLFSWRIPHVYGDDSVGLDHYLSIQPYSLRMWG